MTEEESTAVAAILAEACSGMFGAFAPISVAPRAEDPMALGEDGLIASIRLVGPDLRGRLAVAAGRGFFAQVYPRELRCGNPSDEQVIDWAGEVANQLLGRLKNRLLASFPDLRMTTPVVDRAARISIDAFGPGVIRHAWWIGLSRAEAVLALRHGGPLRLLRALEAGPAAAAAEGDLILF